MFIELARYNSVGSDSKGEWMAEHWNKMKVSEHDGGVMQPSWERHVK